MSTDTRELVEICEALPKVRRSEVVNFARFLLAQEDDEQWERIVNTSVSRPKLEAFLRKSSEESAVPLNTDHLFG